MALRATKPDEKPWGRPGAGPRARRSSRSSPTGFSEERHPDTIGRLLEANSVEIQSGVETVFHAQEQDGSWRARWGVSYVYGTCHALRGLQAAGVSDREAPVLRGGEWLRSIQNADGGWGESCASDAEGEYVPARSTPSQTAWAVLGLLAGGDRTSLSVGKGIEYLVETQLGDGTWDERMPTATGIPNALYWTNPLYRNSFPLLALSSFLKPRREVAHS